MHSELGAHAEARTHFRRALQIYERSLGPEHVNVGMCLANLADIAEDPVEQAALYERALQIYDRTLGPEHPGLASVLYNYSELLLQGRARTPARQAHESSADAAHQQQIGRWLARHRQG